MNQQRQISSDDPPLTAPPRRARLRSRRLLPTIILLLIAVALAAYGARFMIDRSKFVHESDARIVADLTLISSRIGGRIVNLAMSEGMTVSAGQALLQIDRRTADVRLRETEAQMRAIEAERDRLSAEIDMVDLRTKRQYESEQSKLRAAKALLDSLSYEATYAQKEYRRAQSLSKKGVIPHRQLEITRTAFLKAQQAQLRARAQVASAEAELGAAQADRKQIDVLEGERSRLLHKLAERQAQIDNQRIDLQDRQIKSPINGVISRTFVKPGEYVSVGQRIALVHDPSDIWVEAKVKETDYRRLKLGQNVDVHVDAYPDRTFQGKVLRLGHAATSQFSLLPNPNPSGNFTKVTQRLPVKISIEQKEGLLKPGMMVEVSIDVRQR